MGESPFTPNYPATGVCVGRDAPATTRTRATALTGAALVPHEIAAHPRMPRVSRSTRKRTRTVRDWPGCRVPNRHARRPFSNLPFVNLPISENPVGMQSFSCTTVAGTVPLFRTTMVKVTVPPAFTRLGPVFVMRNRVAGGGGGVTDTVALDCSPPGPPGTGLNGPSGSGWSLARI